MQASAEIDQEASRPTPWYGHRWPWLLMLGPFIVVIAGLVTAWIAVTRPDALVVDDYYKQGKAINLDLRRDRVAASMKLRLNAKYDPASGKLIGTLSSGDGPLAATLKVNLIHSTQPEKDLGFAVKSDNQGTFSIALPMLEKARWQILMQDNAGGWRLSGNWIWPQQRTIDIHAAATAPLE